MTRLAVAACMLLACSLASAQSATGGTTAYRDVEGGVAPEPFYVATPDQIIRQGVDRLRGFLTGARDPSPAAIRAFVDVEIAPFFDFDYMARWSAGPLHARLSDDQRALLTARLRDLFLDALTRHLGALERPLPRVDVSPARPGRSMRDASVFARVLAERMLARLEFRFYWGASGWKVYDTVANGASAMAYYRRYFSTMLRRHGPDAVLR